MISQDIHLLSLFFLFSFSISYSATGTATNAVDRPSQTDKSEDASTIFYSDNPLSNKQQSETAIGLTGQVSEITNTS